MTELLLLIFAFICAGLVFWGLAHRERIYQYPFFMGATFIAFILPQAIALVNNPGLIPERAIQRVLIMSCLCAAMCWIGYQVPVHYSQSNRLFLLSLLDAKRLKIGAALYVGISLVFWSLIYSLPQGRAISGLSTGIITVYFFFANLLNIGITILLLETMKKPILANLVMLLVSVGMPIYRAIFFGRREETFFILLAFPLALYFVYKRTLPKALAIFGIIFAIVVIFSISQYRSAIAEGRWDLVDQINPVEILQTTITEQNSESAFELRNAALLIDSTIKTGRYGWGTSYWDRLIFRFVPAQFLSPKFKKNLKFDIADYQVDRKELYKNYNYKSPLGATSTGIGDTFTQFDYLGSLVFALMAVFFKFLWHYAADNRNFVAQLAYILLSVKAMTALTHNTANFPADILYYALFSLPIILWARIPTSYYLSKFDTIHK